MHMPVQTKARPKRRVTSKKASKSVKKSSKDLQQAHHQSSKTFWILFSFVFLFTGMVVMAAIMVLFYTEQVNLSHNLQRIQSTVTAQEQNQAENRLSAFKYIDTEVKGLRLAYSACPSTFTGSCDDAMLFRQSEDGSKQVIIQSLRALKQAPKTTDILQPVFESIDKKWLVLGAWTFGGKRNTKDNRVWIYNEDLGDIIYYSDKVSANAIFSPNYNLAAQAVIKDGDVTEAQVIDLTNNELRGRLKASTGNTFLGPNNVVTMYWESEDTIVVKEYKKPNIDQPTPIENGEKRLKF